MKHSQMTVKVSSVKTLVEGDNSDVSESQDKIWSRPQHPWNSGGVHYITGGLRRFEDTRGIPCEHNSTPITIFLLFVEVIQLLAAEINKYYNQYLGKLHSNDICSQLLDVTVEIHVLLALIQI
jgi:hypothetical protein